ncbi:Uncharacterised protein [uncultured archaeon]|nr:Uncharacterised protein [uncultured archaeon]
MNTMDARRFILGLMLLVLISAIPTNAQNEKSVSLGGHTFTANLPDGWVVSSNMTIDSIDPSSSDWTDLKWSWKGVWAEAFNYPAYPSAPKDSDYYGTISGRVYLFVVKIPDDLRQQLLQHDVAVYGSSDKIPDDRKTQELNDILTDAAHISILNTKYDSEKDITFNDHQAHLSEADDSSWSIGSIAILLDNDTVGIIQPNIEKTHRLGKDSAIFDGSAWDFIEKVTVN